MFHDMTCHELKNKIKFKLWSKLVRFSRNTFFYPLIYRSFWHYLFHPGSFKNNNASCFYAARPNPGAGIGHQMANWISGYWWAKQFKLKFAHIPFSNPDWEKFLSFGQGETLLQELKAKEYKIRKLPLFSVDNPSEFELNRKIVATYSGKNIVFLAEQDQFYREQYGVIVDIKQKFYTSEIRKTEQLIYNPQNFNIAIHVRRGDIVVGQKNKNQNLLLRWQDNDYFINVLKNALRIIPPDKSIAIYLFSQGKKEDYPEFTEFPNLHFCLDMNAQDSFLHMVYSDLLVTSKSSFSYKPALLNNGIKICPKDFWHGYPNQCNWILAENDGSFPTSQLVSQFYD